MRAQLPLLSYEFLACIIEEIDFGPGVEEGALPADLDLAPGSNSGHAELMVWEALRTYPSGSRPE